jgi:carbon storage regulator CsrA
MLVLSRKLNESIVIAGNIRITVTSIRGQCVRLGIEAPEDVGIYREELYSEPAPTPSASCPIHLRSREQYGRELRPITRHPAHEDGGRVPFKVGSSR